MMQFDYLHGLYEKNFENTAAYLEQLEKHYFSTVNSSTMLEVKFKQREIILIKYQSEIDLICNLSGDISGHLLAMQGFVSSIDDDRSGYFLTETVKRFKLLGIEINKCLDDLQKQLQVDFLGEICK